MPRSLANGVVEALSINLHLMLLKYFKVGLATIPLVKFINASPSFTGELVLERRTLFGPLLTADPVLVGGQNIIATIGARNPDTWVRKSSSAYYPNLPTTIGDHICRKTFCLLTQVCALACGKPYVDTLEVTFVSSDPSLIAQQVFVGATKIDPCIPSSVEGALGFGTPIRTPLQCSMGSTLGKPFLVNLLGPVGEIRAILDNNTPYPGVQLEVSTTTEDKVNELRLVPVDCLDGSWNVKPIGKIVLNSSPSFSGSLPFTPLVLDAPKKIIIDISYTFSEVSYPVAQRYADYYRLHLGGNENQVIERCEGNVHYFQVPCSEDLYSETPFLQISFVDSMGIEFPAIITSIPPVLGPEENECFLPFSYRTESKNCSEDSNCSIACDTWVFSMNTLGMDTRVGGVSLLYNLLSPQPDQCSTGSSYVYFPFGL